jgi:hypothetical protein
MTKSNVAETSRRGFLTATGALVAMPIASHAHVQSTGSQGARLPAR